MLCCKSIYVFKYLSYQIQTLAIYIFNFYFCSQDKKKIQNLLVTSKKKEYFDIFFFNKMQKSNLIRVIIGISLLGNNNFFFSLSPINI